MDETKLKEMEEEIKVLKAEIRNVLLDIREVILERTNPLEEGQAPTIRMDLRTTASAVAAEAVAHEARNAMDAAEHASHNGSSPEAQEGNDHVPPHVHAEVVPPVEEMLNEAEEPAEPEEEAPPPKVIRRDPRELKMLAEEREQLEQNDIPIPPAYRRETPSSYRVEFAPLSTPLSGSGSMAVWISEALTAVGPRELSRIIAVHRSWGNLPPNLSRALAYVQEMLEETEDADPAWLRVMRQLDALASL
jgi:chemotaxis protein histidine kinase CheA